jgi:hypothetical protein
MCNANHRLEPALEKPAHMAVLKGCVLFMHSGRVLKACWFEGAGETFLHVVLGCSCIDLLQHTWRGLERTARGNTTSIFPSNEGEEEVSIVVDVMARGS